MEVERTIDFGFHSDFGAFRRNKRSKIPTKLTIILSCQNNLDSMCLDSVYYVQWCAEFLRVSS